jgi:hypothetical protein
MTPFAQQFDPDNAQLKKAWKRTGLTQKETADRIGCNFRVFRHYLNETRPCKYWVWYMTTALRRPMV